MAGAWVCSDCRSVNGPKQTRCYKCHVLRSAGEMTPSAAMLASTARRGEQRTLHETADRMGARYRPSWPLAILVLPLIITVLALDIALAQEVSNDVGAGGRFVDDPAGVARIRTLAIWDLGANFIAVLAWSLWIALVVRNAPALTARWPPNSPIGAFFAAWIPFLNIKRPYSVVRGVLTLLTGGRVTPGLVALAWWLLYLASYFGFWLALLTRGGGSPPAATVSAVWVRLALLVPAGILAATLVVVIERAQQLALRRRDSVVAGVA